MRGSVRKWGNSASVRIPASVMEEAHIALDQTVEIRAEQGRVVIEPIQPETFILDELLARVSPENLHDAIEFGSPVGKEHL